MAPVHVTTRRRSQSAFLASYATTCLLVISVALNFFQARKLGLFSGPPILQPGIGTQLNPLKVRTLDGRPATIDQSRPTIFYYFSPTCVWCERNWPNVKTLIAATSDRYRFVGISSSASNLRAFLDAHQLTLDVYTGVDAESGRVYNFGGTPRTLVVGAGGIVEHVWDGAYVGKRAEVERAFGILLPGTSSVAGTVRP